MAGLESAVSDGVIDRETALRLAPYLAGPALPADTADPDDEKLRLVTGFNDIFVTLGLLLLIGAIAWLLFFNGPFTAGAAIAAASWGLAEFFTRKRRMALPSIVLLIFFVGGVYLAAAGFFVGSWGFNANAAQMMAAAAAAGLAAVLHWRRFQVPITIAAGAAAVVALLLALSDIVAPGVLTNLPVAIFLPLGLSVFALAMWFDSSDLTRQTRRTDIAFWLHLLAAPIIVHPILMSLANGNAPLLAALQVIAVFICLAAVALAVDRRAILVSSLIYLAFAASKLIAAAGMESSSFAVAAFAVGAVVLLLSAAWRPLRRTIVKRLPPKLRARLPAVA